MMDGTKDRSRALNFVGEREIQRAVQDQTKAVNKNGTRMASSTAAGIKNTKNVIPE